MPTRALKILFVASEAHPLVKTGGLGDVAGGLPPALQALRADVRLLLPAYREAIARTGSVKPVAALAIPGLDAPVTLLETKLPGTSVVTWLADFPKAFDRSGNPYLDSGGQPWADNAMRFALLAHVGAAIALGKTTLHWQPNLVHAHDWQTGLLPVLLAREKNRPATVFTIHNLAYQGLFPRETLKVLALAPELWTPEALEFHGQLSFLKGGLVFADRLTTVSPNYAREIQTPEFGAGLDGLLRHRAAHLHGILNGIDATTWNPARDRLIHRTYSTKSLASKAENKRALQRRLGLAQDARVPLIGTVGRLVHQKGVDLLLDALPALMHRPLQFVLLGSGDPAYEAAWREKIERYQGRLAVTIGYDETLAHGIEAGADMFLMPSRFEPCGLNQMYSMRYGTIPLVRRVGGLVDTVIDATPENIAANRATGIVIPEASVSAVLTSVDRALRLWHDPATWKRLMRTGMQQDFSWRHRAGEYLNLYREIQPPG